MLKRGKLIIELLVILGFILFTFGSILLIISSVRYNELLLIIALILVITSIILYVTLGIIIFVGLRKMKRK